MKKLFILGTIFTATAASALAAFDTAKIDELTGLRGKMNEKEGVYKVTFPRNDVKVVVLEEPVRHLRHLAHDARVDLLGGLGLQNAGRGFIDNLQQALQCQYPEQSGQQHDTVVHQIEALSRQVVREPSAQLVLVARMEEHPCVPRGDGADARASPAASVARRTGRKKT